MQPRRTTHDIAFSTFDLRWGILSTRPADARTDATLLQRWLLSPSGEPHPEIDADVRHLVAAAVAAADRRMFIGFRDDTPAFLFEVFDPAYPPQLGVRADLGMRLLAPPVGGGRDLVTASVRVIVEMLFQRPEVETVVLESDLLDTATPVTRAAVGFRGEQRISFRGNDLCLSTCTRDDFDQAHGERHRTPALLAR